MSEGYVSIYVRDSDSVLIDKSNDCAGKITDGVNTQKHKDNLIEIAGNTFDSEITRDIDAYAQEIADADFARIVFHDEYGTEIFWVIDDGELQKFVLDMDEDIDDPRVAPAYEALNRGLESSWLGGAFSKEDVEAMKASAADPREPANFFAHIYPAVEINRRKFQPPYGYYEPHAIEVKDGYTDFQWWPMSADKGKSAEELLEFLLGLGGEEIIAKTTYGNAPLPYQIIVCSKESIRTVFDSNHYSDDEIEFLKQNADEKISEYDWLWPNMTRIREVIQAVDLEQHANERLAEYRAERRREREARENLWAKYPGMQSELVMDQEIYIGYEAMAQEELDNLILQLQIRGMIMGEANTGMPEGWKQKTIETSEETKAAAEWLVANVEELKDYEIKIDPWLWGMAINTH